MSRGTDRRDAPQPPAPGRHPGPVHGPDWPDRARTADRASHCALAVRDLIGGASLELGLDRREAGAGLGRAPRPLRADLRLLGPLALAGLRHRSGEVWAYFEEVGPSQGVVRWPSAIAGRGDRRPAGSEELRLKLGLEGGRAGRAGLVRLDGADGSIGIGAGLDLIAGLGTIAALDRLLARGVGLGGGGLGVPGLPGRRLAAPGGARAADGRSRSVGGHLVAGR